VSRSRVDANEIEYREITPRDWAVVERLFGEKGACGGCWCMWWRVERGGKLWEQTKGARAKRLMKGLISARRARAVIAFDGERPVGWCTFGPRGDFPRLETVKAYRPPDSESVWSIPCFFVLPTHRGRGVGRGLLAAAVAAAKRHGANVLEGYPVTKTEDGRELPAAFAWTGPLAMFEACGFHEASAVNPRRPVVRLTVSTGGSRQTTGSGREGGARRRSAPRRGPG